MRTADQLFVEARYRLKASRSAPTRFSRIGITTVEALACIAGRF